MSPLSSLLPLPCSTSQLPLTRFHHDTLSYFLSLGLTIYFAMGPRWMLPTLIAAIVQVCALLAFTFREFPGGLSEYPPSSISLSFLFESLLIRRHPCSNATLRRKHDLEGRS